MAVQMEQISQGSLWKEIMWEVGIEIGIAAAVPSGEEVDRALERRRVGPGGGDEVERVPGQGLPYPFQLPRRICAVLSTVSMPSTFMRRSHPARGGCIVTSTTPSGVRTVIRCSVCRMTSPATVAARSNRLPGLRSCSVRRSGRSRSMSTLSRWPHRAFKIVPPPRSRRLGSASSPAMRRSAAR